MSECCPEMCKGNSTLAHSQMIPSRLHSVTDNAEKSKLPKTDNDKNDYTTECTPISEIYDA